MIPQAFRVMIPPLTNEFVLLIKDTSLVFVLGVAAARPGPGLLLPRQRCSETFNGTPFIAAALMYLVITLPLTALSRHLERRGAARLAVARATGRRRSGAGRCSPSPTPLARQRPRWDG